MTYFNVNTSVDCRVSIILIYAGVPAGICDVIKQNKSELAIIDLLDKTNNSIQFPLYFIVLSITTMAISLEPYAQF